MIDCPSNNLFWASVPARCVPLAFLFPGNRISIRDDLGKQQDRGLFQGRSNRAVICQDKHRFGVPGYFTVSIPTSGDLGQ